MGLGKFIAPALGAAAGGALGFAASGFNPLGAVAGAGLGADVGAKFQAGREQDKFSKKERRRLERERKRAAIGRALGVTPLGVIQETKQPSLTGLQTISGLGQVAGQLGAGALAGGQTSKLAQVRAAGGGSVNNGLRVDPFRL